MWVSIAYVAQDELNKAFISLLIRRPIGLESDGQISQRGCLAECSDKIWNGVGSNAANQFSKIQGVVGSKIYYCTAIVFMVFAFCGVRKKDVDSRKILRVFYYEALSRERETKEPNYTNPLRSCMYY